METGKLIVLTGPSGVGKGTLVRSLLQGHPELVLSISATTRAPREGEVDGKDYFFLSRPKFEEMVKLGELLEWAEFAGNLYGTPRGPALDRMAEGKSVLLEIELLGARQVRKSFPEALTIFILPPSMSELERRLRGRGLDPEEAIARRLQRATEEVEAAGEFKFQIVNDDLEKALGELEGVLGF